jgi:ankyrin repeat domain-containing protein 50
MHGPVGTGKTIATSFLIRRLLETKPPGTLLAYFFYDASTVETLTPETFFGAIVKQFCSELPELPMEITDAYKFVSSRVGSPKQPSLDQVKSFLHLLLTRHDSAIIVVDGLDESSTYESVANFLTSTVVAGENPLRVFVSSRPENDLRRHLSGFPEIPVPEVQIEQDISVYIKMRIDSNPRLRRMNDKMKAYVEATLSRESNGMYVNIQHSKYCP